MKILGIDYGKSKVGLAIAEDGRVQPYGVMSVSIIKQQILKIVEENVIARVVIGLTGGGIDGEIKRFGEGVKILTGLPVEYIDETLTTQDAQKLLINVGKSRRRRKASEDAVAAAIMLQYYLEGGVHD